MKILSTFAVTVLAFGSAHALVELDFTNYVASTQPDDAGGMQFDNVGLINGEIVDAALFATTAYDAGTGGSLTNGVQNDDDMFFRVRAGTTTTFQLVLFEDGTSTPFTSASSYTVNLATYDVDGSSSRNEVISYATPGTYQIAGDSDITIGDDDGVTTFTGRNSGISAVSDTENLTADQERGLVIFTFDSVNTIEFTYGSTGSIANGARGFFLDGNTIDGFDNSTPVDGITAVPEPQYYAILMSLVAAFMIARRSKQSKK